MLRFLLVSILVLSAVGLGLIAFLVWRGPEPGGIDDLYTRLFGPADLGPVEFETLARRAAPNDSLACPPGVCPKAVADLVPPVFGVNGPTLRRALREIAAADGAELVYAETSGLTDRFVARTPLMRFPDTVDAMIVDRGPDAATLALYSRSQIGHSDLGANRARLARWLEALGARFPAAG
jgi:uncharacterized protein (DUF1499 family)